LRRITILITTFTTLFILAFSCSKAAKDRAPLLPTTPETPTSALATPPSDPRNLNAKEVKYVKEVLQTMLKEYARGEDFDAARILIAQNDDNALDCDWKWTYRVYADKETKKAILSEFRELRKEVEGNTLALIKTGYYPPILSLEYEGKYPHGTVVTKVDGRGVVVLMGVFC